ncbi:endonuclease V [Saccharophagus sp. K07]|jgi:deoxyribonuclease V|nr:endonuclease V [Saccharophagus sp. K07]MBC6905799.1 endonuclease V [Saccharophagus sp. K07]
MGVNILQSIVIKKRLVINKGNGVEKVHWQGNTVELRKLQERLREQISEAPLGRRPRTIGGADVSLNRGSKTVYAGIVVLDYETLQPITQSGVVEEVEVPYVPGYLSFREVPALYRAWGGLELKPDVVMVDGHGIMHPRKMGVASHFGLAAEVPSLGCAKKPLSGEFIDPELLPGSISTVKYQGEMRGFCYRSRKNSRPIFISPGTGMSCDDALEITRHCLRGYRLPEPTRLAHLYVNQLRINSAIPT